MRKMDFDEKYFLTEDTAKLFHERNKSVKMVWRLILRNAD